MFRDRVERCLADLRRVITASAIDEVVRFVDDEHAVAVVVLLLIRFQSDVRIEDVVVVADDDVGLLDELERYFERTDFRRLRELERDVGIEVRHLGGDAIQQAALLHFFGVARGVRTEIFVADHLRVRAHFLFRADAENAERAVVQHRQRFDGDVLLQRLRREEKQLFPEAK